MSSVGFSAAMNPKKMSTELKKLTNTMDLHNRSLLGKVPLYKTWKPLPPPPPRGGKRNKKRTNKKRTNKKRTNKKRTTKKRTNKRRKTSKK